MVSEKDILITTLNELKHDIGEGEIVIIKEKINWFHQNLVRNKQLLSELYTSGIQCTTQTDLILAACQNKQADILYYIFNETDILVHLTDDRFDDTDVNQQRTEAFNHALRLDAFNMVEMMYDYWCGNLHWIGHDMNNIKIVGNVLKNAFVVCPDRQLKANFHSLIKFNDVQCEIYTKLPQLKSSSITPKDTATMLLKVLRVYDEYSHLEKVRIPHTKVEHEMKIRANLEDKSSTFTRIQEYILYEVYYRKLDFNVILLILENLSDLRKHLQDRLNKDKNLFNDYPKLSNRCKHDAELYKEIECAIYYFIYRTSEDWRLYLPKNRQLIKEDYHTGIQKGNIKLTIDLHKLYNGPVIFFERKYLKKCIKKMKKILRIHFICADPALKLKLITQNQKKSKVTLLDVNYLQTLRYMSDHYSLLKIVYYIEAIENTTCNNVLMIERVLHVIGEMLKTTDASAHLSRSTHELLRIAISVEPINQLHNLRNFLSHADSGQLSTRIDIANTQAQTFAEVKQELIIIKQIINSVLDIYKSILDKSLLEKGYRLLEQRIEGLPDKAARHIDEIYRKYKIHKNDLVSESGQFNQEVWRHTGLSIQLLEEIPWILDNQAKIFSKIQCIKTQLSNTVVSILPASIQYLRQTLLLIIEINNNVIKINQQLFNYAKIDLGLTKDLENYNNNQWNYIKEMLAFCLNDCELLASISHFENSLPNTPPTVRKVYNILTELEAVCAMHRSTLAWISGKRAAVWGLRIYRLYANWKGLGLNQNHFVAIEKLHNDTVSKKKTPDNSRMAREKLIECLINRLDLLKQTLLYPQQIPLSQHVGRFNYDVNFRVTLEMLLADIANVFADCDIRLMYKSSKLLRNIDLGNVLDHGNPFLEVIGNVFNSHDLSAELLDKAMVFAGDGESIEALYKLFIGGMNYQTIVAGDLLKMDAQQKVLYKQFRKSPNWKSYTKLTMQKKNSTSFW